MIVVAGATGNVGREVVRQLVDAGEQVRALVRDTTASVPVGAEAVAGDLTDPSSLAPALTGADALFLLSGYPPEIFAEAEKAGVRRVALLSGGSAETGDRSNAVASYMIATEDALRASARVDHDPAADVHDQRLQWAPADSRRCGASTWPDVPPAVIDPADIAAVAAKALAVGGPRGPRVPGDRPGGVAAREPGRGSWPRHSAARSGTRRSPTMKPVRRCSHRCPTRYVDAFFSFYSDGKLDEATVYPTVLEVTGRRPRTFAEWARANAGRFQ